MLRVFSIVSGIALCGLQLVEASAPSVALVVKENKAPVGFELVGEYLVSCQTKVREGASSTSPIAESRYLVYSNGVELRLYQAKTSATFSTYNIYRSDGVSKQSANGAIIIQPGVQARHVSEKILQHLCITQDNLTLTKFPPISDTVVVIHAKRLRNVE